MTMTTLTTQTERETGRKMAEVDYVIGAPFAVTWQNVPRTRAFWAGYAIGWIDAEETDRAAHELVAYEPFEPFEPFEPYAEEEPFDSSEFELDCAYRDMFGSER